MYVYVFFLLKGINAFSPFAILSGIYLRKNTASFHDNTLKKNAFYTFSSVVSGAMTHTLFILAVFIMWCTHRFARS